MSAITISLFGSLQVTGSSGQLIPVNGAKLQGLLSYLALNSDVFPTRDRLASVFWGERFTEQSRQSLRQSILKLRKLLNANGVDVLTTQNDRVGLRQEHVEIDVDRFVNLVAANEPQSDLEATKLYSGELLGDLYVRELEFEDWLLSERQRITTIACPAFERAANYLVQRGNSEAALDISRRLIAFDPLREPSYCLQMRILAQSGQRAAAVQLYNQCAAVLARELQVEPGPETRKLLEEIRHVGFESSADTGEAAARGDVLPASQTAAPQAARKPGSTIAVLPFAGTLRGTDEDRLALMFADDLTEALSRYRWLDVMASPVAGSDRLTSEEMQRFSRDNGLKYAVSGSIRRTEEKVRLTVQLIVLEHGRYAWVRHFDWEGGDLSPGIPEQLRDRIAASI